MAFQRRSVMIDSGLELEPGLDDNLAVQMGGNPDIWTSSAAQMFPLGSKLTDLATNRVWRYAKMGAVVGVAGNLYQSVVPLATHANMVCAVAAAGATVVSPTLGAAAILANQFAGGFLVINNEAGEGHFYRVKSHPASAGTEAIPVTLYDPLKVALVAATSRATLVMNPYDSVIIHPSPPTAKVVGLAPFAVTANHYFWLQTQGPAAVLTEGVLVAGKRCVASVSADGAVAPPALTEGVPNTGYDQQFIGSVIYVCATTEYSPIWLQLG